MTSGSDDSITPPCPADGIADNESWCPLSADPDKDPEAGQIYQTVIEQVERPLIKLALAATSGNKVRAAALLGLNRNTLRSKINGLGVGPED